MLVTFHSKSYSSITMFGDVAVTLLKMAGHSGTVPSALLADDIPRALARLKEGLAAAGTKEIGKKSARQGAEEEDDPQPVGLRQRSYPLIQMLSASAQQGCDVTWEAGDPAL
ncbi:MAG: DUF1840 domain-containing protein [Betaproteobacteria bacterium]|nr:DUF1840 domain-containing protein [Betaproteobacteria bacterium]